MTMNSSKMTAPPALQGDYLRKNRSGRKFFRPEQWKIYKEVWENLQ